MYINLMMRSFNNSQRQGGQPTESEESAHQPHCEGRLLEEWPRRASSLEAAQPSVNISETSSLYVYHDDDLYCKNKAYSSQDRHIFEAQAMIEANRIKNLIYTSPPASVKESVKYVLQNNIVTRDEIVGIEHLILGGRRTSVSVERRDHMMAVLWKQEELRQLQQHPQPQVEEDSLIALSKFAEQSSLKSTHSAIVRATLATSTPSRTAASHN